MNTLAQRKSHAVNRHTKESGKITFALLAPYPIDDGENYMCTIQIRGLHQEEVTVGGIDAMQALLLATETLRNRFDQLRDEAYDLYWPGGRSEKPELMKSLDYRISTQ